ncbi:MAG: hypothetical protein ABIS35_00700 [Terracoccus sp.]
MAVTQATRLSCGRDVDEVWANIGGPPTVHEESCPACTRARADLAELSSATDAMVDADRQDASLRVPEGRLADILAIVRTEVRRGRMIPLLRSAATEPELAVSEQVVATVVRATCDLDPQVEVRRVNIVTVPPSSAAGDALEPGDVAMDLQVTVGHAVAIPRVLEGLRTAIRRAVAGEVGVTVSRIDIDVQDVHDA